MKAIERTSIFLARRGRSGGGIKTGEPGAAKLRPPFTDQPGGRGPLSTVEERFGAASIEPAQPRIHVQAFPHQVFYLPFGMAWQTALEMGRWPGALRKPRP
jgi:hypothetical protein